MACSSYDSSLCGSVAFVLQACDLLLSSLSDSDGFLLSLQNLVDLSPAGIQYSLQSFQIQDDVLILDLGVSTKHLPTGDGILLLQKEINEGT
ncbi:Hypothetical predicted protein [Podarcis lilfordi]|uniref:Uncharacterized protein n=1 Tax=Podarcis lilfordi TaxID=74358 RepID=A0AA35KKJ7_9SAUR|nr:Hypothetical predicted protein [Podarcis lilfordi]